MPDADRVRRALERCELVVVSDMRRATRTLTAYAHVLLPAAALGRERSGTRVTNSERRISRQRAFLALARRREAGLVDFVGEVAQAAWVTVPK